MCKATIRINDFTHECQITGDHEGAHVTRVITSSMVTDGFEWEVTSDGNVQLDINPAVAIALFIPANVADTLATIEYLAARASKAEEDAFIANEAYEDKVESDYEAFLDIHAPETDVMP